MDRSVKPGDDFYAFANGKWAERTEIPADRVRYGSGDTLQALSEARIHAILEEAAAGKLVVNLKALVNRLMTSSSVRVGIRSMRDMTLLQLRSWRARRKRGPARLIWPERQLVSRFC
mgnify:CR=1 FL=1